MHINTWSVWARVSDECQVPFILARIHVSFPVQFTVSHSRFSCAQDFVPLVPFCNLDGYNPFNWKLYKHVGMRVQLHGVGRVAKWRLRNALDVTYPLCHDFLSEIKRLFINSLFVNLNTLKGYKRNHTLTEHQRSVHFAHKYRLALGKSSKCCSVNSEIFSFSSDTILTFQLFNVKIVFFNDQRRNRIKSLDEYILLVPSKHFNR